MNPLEMHYAVGWMQNVPTKSKRLMMALKWMEILQHMLGVWLYEITISIGYVCVRKENESKHEESLHSNMEYCTHREEFGIANS